MADLKLNMADGAAINLLAAIIVDPYVEHARLKAAMVELGDLIHQMSREHPLANRLAVGCEDMLEGFAKGGVENTFFDQQARGRFEVRGALVEIFEQRAAQAIGALQDNAA